LQQKEKYSFSPAYATLVGTILGLVMAAILCWIYIHFKGSINILEFRLYHVAILFLLIVIHEVIHIFVFLIDPDCKLSHIKVGFNRKYLLPYVHCSAVVSVRTYRSSTCTPANYLGFVPTFSGYLSGNPVFFLFGVVMLSSSMGDLMVLWKIRKLKRTQLVKDHPARVGCQLVEER